MNNQPPVRYQALLLQIRASNARLVHQIESLAESADMASQMGELRQQLAENDCLIRWIFANSPVHAGHATAVQFRVTEPIRQRVARPYRWRRLRAHFRSARIAGRKVASLRHWFPPQALTR